MRYLLLFPLVFISSISFCQSGFNILLNAGGSLSKSRFGQELLVRHTKSYTAPAFSLLAEKNVCDRFVIGTGVSHYRKGMRERFPVDISSREKYTLHRLDYIVIPLYAGLNLFSPDKLRVQITAGGYMGYLLKAQSILYEEGGSELNRSEAKDHYKSTDFGLTAGISARKNICNSFFISLSTEAQIGLKGLTKWIVVDPDDPLLQSGNSQLKGLQNFSLSLMAGVGYRFGRKEQTGANNQNSSK